MVLTEKWQHLGEIWKMRIKSKQEKKIKRLHDKWLNRDLYSLLWKTDNEINLKRFKEGLTEVNFSVSLSLTMTSELQREKRGGARFVSGEKIFPLD